VIVVCPKMGYIKEFIVCLFDNFECNKFNECYSKVNEEQLLEEVEKYVEKHPGYKIGGNLIKTQTTKSFGNSKKSGSPLIFIPKKLKIGLSWKEEDIFIVHENDLVNLIDNGKVEFRELLNYDIIQITNIGRKPILTLKKVQLFKEEAKDKETAR